MHQWIVRRTIGDRVPSRRPAIERKVLTSELSVSDAVDPAAACPRAAPRETIERVLIGHIHTHRADIQAKLQPGE